MSESKPKREVRTVKKYQRTFTQSIIQLIVNGLALSLVISLSPDITATGFGTSYIAVFVMALINWLVQPLLRLITRLFGTLGLLALSFFSNAVILAIVINILPNLTSTSFWGTFWASWLYALIITIVNWLMVARSQEVFLADILRRTAVRKPNVTDATGFVFVQLDGVSAPVLDWELKAGNLPNISKLLRDEGYVFDTWRTQVPSTTPASQAGILLGSNDNIPAFRWYEKDRGELVVANQFKGAALIEKRLSTGNGLLADGGVSIGNLFSGDAPTNVMVMSKVAKDRESKGDANDFLAMFSSFGSFFSAVGRSIGAMFKGKPGEPDGGKPSGHKMDTFNVAFFTTPTGFMRALVLAIGEMFKEIYQARRAITKDVQPRIHRGGSYILLRAATNVLMRDMQTSMIVKNMQAGVNSIYVDFLDYDEIAHHAGLARPESLASLVGLDEVVGLLMLAREYAARPYEIILLSDHGQSQGPTFEQLNGGVDLKSLVHLLIGDESEESLVMTGSGNLGNLWLTRYEGRATLEELEADYPELISGLLGTKSIGFVMVMSKERGPLAVSATGTCELESGKVTGENPMAPYPEGTREDLLRVTTMKAAPDVCVMSAYDPDRGEVYAFEGLVGNHGGIGGWQTEAVLLHSAKYKVAERHITHGRIRGAHTVHNILVDWLKHEGQHTGK